VLGPADALRERPYRRTGVALTNLSMLKFRAEEWIDLLEDSFELARGAVANTVRGVAALEVRRWAMQKDPRGRVMLTGKPGQGAMSFVDRLAAFSELPVLRAAGVQVLADVVGLVEERTFAKGEVLWTRGESPQRSFLVIEGEVIGERADPPLQVRFGPGTAVAGTGALGAPAIEWTARASAATRTLSLHWEDWSDLMEEHFDLVRSALTGLAVFREEILEEIASEIPDLVLT
jgi:hypothetical protein